MDLAVARKRLIESISPAIKDKRVLEVMGRISRELFVTPAYKFSAYEDKPLPIEMGQTISQPLIVALMTEALELQGSEKVLEIGAGSGYQAAILAELAKQVVTTERHTKLADNAKRVLDELGYKNIEIHVTEKGLGWEPGAPYDAIIVTAGAPKIPQELLDQLKDGGRLVIPVGSYFEQDLLKITKKGKGIKTEDLGPCRFVPLIYEGGWKE